MKKQITTILIAASLGLSGVAMAHDAGPAQYGGIVQTAGGISIFYDVGQGQGFQRNIVMNGGPHLPASVRQWHGDSRAKWDGDTLVVDVTNFSPKTDFFGSRENLHLIERWTRTGPETLEYRVTIEDPTVWTRPWTVKVEGLVHKPKTYDIEELLRFPLEERVYSLRCVEGWSMVIPWIGFPLAALLKLVRTLATNLILIGFAAGLAAQFLGGPFADGAHVDRRERELRRPREVGAGESLCWAPPQ